MELTGQSVTNGVFMQDIKVVRFYFYQRKHVEYLLKWRHEIRYGSAKKALQYRIESQTYLKAMHDLDK
ncbi:conserved hypothetical protein [Vibrio phage ICP3]|uniref:Uncharacterized protein orf23 n=1 Tax=Vibrio phage ICP3 TaxID=979535 RepID=F1D019_9CAUD|nr:hypothetical protein ViPhICP3_gp23 [Vibrio phage ICP3]ADX87463.1 conserved hypothetical protein [Vibrio phage ICP3]